jgi:transcriptional regulator with XRE-family HTH domain
MSSKRATKGDAIIGGRIRALRIAKHMSQHDLGNAIGVTFQQVQKYEAGANRITTMRLLAIGSALGRPITYFVRDLEVA